MKNRIQLALMGCVLSIGAHLYLTLHYYPLKFGFSTSNSVCNLNEKFNCDAVSVSNYSALFGIPMAAWGAVFNCILFLMILLAWLEWTDHPERLKRWSVFLAGLSLGTSIVMASISLTLMSSYCLFCLALYLLSAIIFFSLVKWTREPFWAGLADDLPSMWTESRGILMALAAIPLFAFLTHRIFMQNLGEGQISNMVNESIQEWEQSPKVDFVAKPTLVMGANTDSALLTLVEFADFRCGHCRRASYTLHAFVQAHPDVRFEYYTFPLDGACNEKITQSSGLSCRLAATVYCSEKENKGWPVHDLIYDKQDVINGLVSVQDIDHLLAKEVVPLGLNWESLQRCMSAAETSDAIKAQAKQGGLVNVMGTPTIFANGRMLSRGHMVPVLQAAHAKAKELKSQ